MGIIKVAERANGRSGSIDQQFHRTYVRNFLVLTDSYLTDAKTVMLAPGIPRPYESYAVMTDAGLVVDREALAQQPTAVQPDPDAPDLWSVDVNYSTRSSDPSKNDADEAANPIDRRPRLDWRQRKRELPFVKAYTLDDDGNVEIDTETGNPVWTPVVASNWERFNPPPLYEETDEVLMIVRNELTFSRSIAKAFVDTVCSTGYGSSLPREARILSIEASERFEKNLAFWEVHYEIAFRDGGWALELENTGSYYITGLAGPGGDLPESAILADADYSLPSVKIVELKDIAGNGITNVRLDKFGQRLKLAKPSTFKTFVRYPPVDWGPLNLPPV